MSDEMHGWTSGYDGTEGSACIGAGLDWRQSTHNDDQGGRVEGAGCPHSPHVRDSRLGGASPAFAVVAGARAASLGGVTG
ncbi:DUF397 domain-containing protein [Streptomyces sp. NPDC059175]|uniref:DUF397 domain-containing protein n=1 Tax=unclassified Streptomyces TaxID=2593676 RepID=UPI0036BDC1E2